MTRLLLAVLVSAIAAVSSLAQSPARTAAARDELRASAVGEIRNRSGEPWVGAEVVLLSRPLPDDPDTGEPDEVIATTDAQGRFTAAILRGRPYTAWAWGKATAEGRPATAVTESVSPRRRILVPGGLHLGFRATRGMSMLIRGFETSRGRPDDGPAVAQFQMPPPTGIRGRLLEPGGGPGGDRTVFATFNTDNQPAAWSYASEDVGVLADKEHNRLRVLLPDELRERLLLTSLIAKHVATDEEGLFALPLPAEPIPGLQLFTGRTGARSFFDSITVDWRGETKDDLEWRASF